MPSYLHPRSRSTTSLFAATLLASFLIVGMPHVFPCPAPRRAFADSEMITTADGQQRIRRRRKVPSQESTMADGQLSDQQQIQQTLPSPLPIARSEPVTARQLEDEHASEFQRREEEARRLEKIGRECPVPKPGGLLGQVFGFNADKDSEKGRDGISKPIVFESKNVE